MVLEASRQHNQALHNTHDPARALQAGVQKNKCKSCGSTTHPDEKCWVEHFELAPSWFKEKMKDQAKAKGKGGEQARKFQAKLAMAFRDDDFEDIGSTHISC